MNNSSNISSINNSNNVQTRIDEHRRAFSPSETNTGSAIGIPRLTNSTVINMDSDGAIGAGGTNGGRSDSARSVQRNFLSLFNEARSQLGRQASYPGPSASNERRELYFNGGGAGGDSIGSGPSISDSIIEERIFNASSNNSSGPSSSPSISHGRNIRSWRTNLNNVLSFSSSPSTEALRSFITHSGNFRYTPLNTSENASNADDNIHLLLNQRTPSFALDNNSSTRGLRLNSLRTFRSNSMRDEGANAISASLLQHNSSTTLPSVGGDGASASLTMPQDLPSPSTSSMNRQYLNATSTASSSHQHSVTGNNRTANAAAPPPPTGQDIDEENNVISDIFVKVLSHFVRYLPFICILFVKFIHDHLLGILDLLLLHSIMYQVNKSLREQIAKFSHKSYGALLRDVSLVTLVVAYRLVLASSTPDPFGLLITPALGSVTIEVTTNSMNQLTPNPQPSSGTADSTASPTPVALENTVTITKAISLGVLLYYVAVNDLILKLITILVKISITMMPTKMIRHKPRARMYVLIEFLSQFYRALAPVRQWLMFLFKSYSGLDVISGILFSSFYMGAKGFEFVERGKSLRKALVNFVRNMDYERKPTNDELDAAGSQCPICHDTFSAPVVLECGHIFCDDCVSTWFKREQTCPMCRAKVSEDPTWQDGSTTFFYQLC